MKIVELSFEQLAYLIGKRQGAIRAIEVTNKTQMLGIVVDDDDSERRAHGAALKVDDAWRSPVDDAARLT